MRTFAADQNLLARWLRRGRTIVLVLTSLAAVLVGAVWLGSASRFVGFRLSTPWVHLRSIGSRDFQIAGYAGTVRLETVGWYEDAPGYWRTMLTLRGWYPKLEWTTGVWERRGGLLSLYVAVTLGEERLGGALGAGKARGFAAPGWLLLLILGGPSVYVWRRRLRLRRQRLRYGLCRTCGYDLRGTPNRCPECGRATSDQAS